MRWQVAVQAEAATADHLAAEAGLVVARRAANHSAKERSFQRTGGALSRVPVNTITNNAFGAAGQQRDERVLPNDRDR